VAGFQGRSFACAGGGRSAKADSSKAEIEACKQAGQGAVRSSCPVAFDAVRSCGQSPEPFVELSLHSSAHLTEAGKANSLKQSVNSSFPDAPLKLLAPDAQFDGSNYFSRRSSSPEESARRDFMGSVDDNVLNQASRADLNTLSFLPMGRTSRTRQAARRPIARSEGAEAVTPSPETSGREVPAPVASDLPLRERLGARAPRVAALAPVLRRQRRRLAAPLATCPCLIGPIGRARSPAPANHRLGVGRGDTSGFDRRGAARSAKGCRRLTGNARTST